MLPLVEVPTTCTGRAISIRGSLAVREKSASAEIPIPAAMTPPTYSPPGRDGVEGRGGPEVDGDGGSSDQIQRGQGVGHPISPHVGLRLVPDGQQRLTHGIHHQGFASDVAAGQGLEALVQRRDHAADRDILHSVHPDARHAKKMVAEGGVLVHGPAPARGDPPRMLQSRSVEKTNDDVGVPDVDDQKHGSFVVQAGAAENGR